MSTGSADAGLEIDHPQARGGLRRQVGFVGLMWASVGSIIGSGWLYGAKNAVVTAGPAALVSWLVGAVAVLLLALVHAELGGMLPVAGGTARFPHYAFGTLAGVSFGWFSWLQAATTAAIEVEAVIGYMTHWSWAQGFQHDNGVLTSSGLLVAVLLMAVFVGVNFLGIRVLSHTNSTATWWKVFVPLVAIWVLAATHFDAGNFTAQGFAPFGVKGILAGISSSGVIFALLGFEQAVQLAGESKNPARHLPRAVMGAVGIGAVLYIALQIVFIAALPRSSFAHGWDHLQFAGINGPFAGLATLLGLGWLAWVLYFDAIVSPGGTGLIYTTAASRVSVALSRNGYAPQVFDRHVRGGVPWFGLLVSFVTGVICFLPFPSWQQLVGFITSASVLMYAGAPLAFGALRKRLPDVRRPYRLPFGGVVSPLSFVVANLIVYWSGWTTVWHLGLATVLGYLLMGGYVLHRNGTAGLGRSHWRAASWLPAYLAGMGVLSWQGGFDGTGNIPLWWDIALVAVFSAAIYYWAVAVALGDREIAALIAEAGDAGDLSKSDAVRLERAAEG